MLPVTAERLLLNLLLIAIDQREIEDGERFTIPEMARTLRHAFTAPEGTVSLVERSMPAAYKAANREALQLMETWFPDAK